MTQSMVSVGSVVDTVVADLVASYAGLEGFNEETEREPRQDKAPKARKARAPKVKKETAEALPAKPMASPFLPPTGLDAAGFIKACNAAKGRQDEINAIAAYVGYDLRQSHGTQLDAARHKARFALKPVKGNSKVSATVAGFVAGMPDHGEKAVQNLQARIRSAMDRMLDLEKQAETAEGSKRAELMTLATLESERMASMRKDLEGLGVTC